jgi:flagellar basal body-associated protein FliL
LPLARIYSADFDMDWFSIAGLIVIIVLLVVLVIIVIVLMCYFWHTRNNKVSPEPAGQGQGRTGGRAVDKRSIAHKAQSGNIGLDFESSPIASVEGSAGE